MSTELANIEAAPEIINAIAAVEGGEMDKEEVIGLYDKLTAIKQAAGETVKRMETAMIAWIGQHGSIELGTKRWYVGTDKKTKPRGPNMRTFYKALLIALGGDEEAFANCLASGAFKHGAAKKSLVEMYGEEAGLVEYEKLFETTETPSLEEGKPKKSLQVADTKFLK